MALGPGHLVERVAARLRGVGGVNAPVDPAGEATLAMPPQPPGEEALLLPPPVYVPPAPGEAPQATPSADAAPVIAAALAAAIGGPAASQGGAAADAMLARVAADAPGGLSRVAAELSPAARGGDPAITPGYLDLEALERAGLVVGRKLRTRISEEFRVTVGTILRSLKTSYTPGRGSGNLVMVTSSRPGEGKSFTSLNLAGSIAQHTQREVLLVDVDAKQNSLTDQLGVGDRPGLVDLAASATLRIEDTVIRTSIPNLLVLPVGIRRFDGEMGEGTVARPVSSLIERLARRYSNHLIILDAPPCLSTSDPSTFAQVVGQIILVVEAEKTQKSEVLASLDLIKACPSIMLMLNKIKVTTSYTFGAYHYFGTYS
jgi:receptor protein-tyrosine kinase